MDIIQHLRSQPFVHIISEPRSGSNALYNCLKENTAQDKELSVKFWHQNFEATKHVVPNHLKHAERRELFHNNISAMCDYISNNMHKVRVIKNHLMDMQDYRLRDQHRLWQLPAYTVGLSRRDTFEQTLSRCLSKLTGIYHINESLGDHTVAKTISPELFLEHLGKITQRKQDMHRHKIRFNQFIYYEDITFPAHMSRYRFPPKSHTVKNLSQLQDLYHKHKA